MMGKEEGRGVFTGKERKGKGKREEGGRGR